MRCECKHVHAMRDITTWSEEAHAAKHLSIRQNTAAYVSKRQHTSAYVSTRSGQSACLTYYAPKTRPCVLCVYMRKRSITVADEDRGGGMRKRMRTDEAAFRKRMSTFYGSACAIAKGNTPTALN
jgi:hypothetical protein